MIPGAAPSMPWSSSTTIRVVAIQAGAVVVGLVAWLGANAESGVREQIPWLDLAVIAAVVAGAAQAGWLLHVRRAVSLRRRELLDRYSQPTTAGATISGSAAHSGHRFRLEGSTWYHELDCLLIRDKPVMVVDRLDGLEPCAVCQH